MSSNQPQTEFAKIVSDFKNTTTAIRNGWFGHYNYERLLNHSAELLIAWKTAIDKNVANTRGREQGPLASEAATIKERLLDVRQVQAALQALSRVDSLDKIPQTNHPDFTFFYDKKGDLLTPVSEGAPNYDKSKQPADWTHEIVRPVVENQELVLQNLAKFFKGKDRHIGEAFGQMAKSWKTMINRMIDPNYKEPSARSVA